MFNRSAWGKCVLALPQALIFQGGSATIESPFPMQHVTAFSRAETVPAAPAAALRPNLWILNSWRDLILYVGTPLLLVPMFALAQARWSAQEIYLFVAAFGAMGHHLPGMIRAYGDRALFQRFRWRFIVAPLFLVGTCIVFYAWDLKGILLVVFFWGVWHGMMQTYGFCRIYDAKTRSFAALNRRLDFLTCGVWFATAVFLSSPRMTDTLGAYYSSGAPFIPFWVLRALQQGLLMVAIGVGVLFFANFFWMWSRGQRPNPVKLALVVTSVAFWFYCNNGVTNILAGIALFEVFHDVQYLSLVWIYNRNRVEKDNTIGGFMRFVFRRSGSLIGLYIGLIFAYGSLAFFNSHLEVRNISRILTGVVTASALLHFYYDGFIWKMRESSTRQGLGLEGGSSNVVPAGVMRGWFGHGLKWVAAFIIPLGALWWWQVHGPASPVQRAAWVVADLPNGGRQHFKYADELRGAGKLDEAVAEYQTGLKFEPRDEPSLIALGEIYTSQSKFDAAAESLATALQIKNDDGETHYDYGYVLQRLGRRDEAIEQYRLAAEIAPKFALGRLSYGQQLAAIGRLDEAIGHLQGAIEAKPDLAPARFELAKAFYSKGDLDRAKSSLAEAQRLDPTQAPPFNLLGVIFLKQGQLSQATVQFQEALRLQPDFQEAEQNLRIAQGNGR